MPYARACADGSVPRSPLRLFHTWRESCAVATAFAPARGRMRMRMPSSDHDHAYALALVDKYSKRGIGSACAMRALARTAARRAHPFVCFTLRADRAQSLLHSPLYAVACTCGVVRVRLHVQM
jgi:GNAT superfamily N-acetyltransferase